VLVGGSVAGVWNGARTGDRFALTIDLFDRADPAMKEGIEGAAERVAAAHGATLDLRYGRVFAAVTENLSSDEPGSTVGP
jgi:hypothetical protein